jgi:hypothetical protein
MALIFHHNMEKYGGAVIQRNKVFDDAYSSIGKKSNDEFIVAGFTEIVNNGKGIEFRDRAKCLDSKLTSSVLIDVGKMARSGNSEYIGIAWNPSMITVENAGQVVTLNDRTIKVLGEPANNFPNAGAINQPGPDKMSIKPDDRGLAWIKGSVNGYSPWIFAFMHNMYENGDRSSSFTNIKLMYQSLKDAFGKPVGLYWRRFQRQPAQSRR